MRTLISFTASLRHANIFSKPTSLNNSKYTLCFSFSVQLIWIDTFQSSFNVTLFVVVGDRFLLYSSGWPPIHDPPASAPPMLEFSHPTTMMPFSLCELKQNSLGVSHWLLKMVLMGWREREKEHRIVSPDRWVSLGSV